MPEHENRQRNYLISPRMISILAALSTVGMVALLLLFPLLNSVRPQGRPVLIDRGTYQQSAEAATGNLSGYRDNGDGTFSIDISEAIELVAERGVEDPFAAEVSAPPAADAAESGTAGAVADVEGETVYAAHCAACHQAGGQGIPGAFPPLANHVHDLYAAERGLLLDVVLHGLQGQITVDGMIYNGMMPAWTQLSDAEIAAVTNFSLVNWDGEPAGFEPFDSAEVAEKRDEALSPSDVQQRRTEAGLD